MSCGVCNGKSLQDRKEQSKMKRLRRQQQAAHQKLTKEQKRLKLYKMAVKEAPNSEMRKIMLQHVTQERRKLKKVGKKVKKSGEEKVALKTVMKKQKKVDAAANKLKLMKDQLEKIKK